MFDVKKLDKFAGMVEGDITGRDCLIVTAAYDEELERLHADARMLRYGNSSMSTDSSRKIENFVKKFEKDLLVLDKADRFAVERLCEKINDSYYRENVDLFALSVEAYIKIQARDHLNTTEDLAVIVDIQQGDVLTPDSLLILKADCDLTNFDVSVS